MIFCRLDCLRSLLVLLGAALRSKYRIPEASWSGMESDWVTVHFLMMGKARKGRNRMNHLLFKSGLSGPIPDSVSSPNDPESCDPIENSSLVSTAKAPSKYQGNKSTRNGKVEQWTLLPLDREGLSSSDSNQLLSPFLIRWILVMNFSYTLKLFFIS